MNSSTPGVGTSPDPVQDAAQKQAALKKEADLKEQNRRKKEQDDLARLEKEVNAYLHHQKYSKNEPMDKPRTASDIQDAMAKQTGKGGLMAASESSLTTGVLSEGIYTFKGIDIRVNDKGWATFVNPPQDPDKLIDFLCERTGDDTIYISFPTFPQTDASGKAHPNAGKPNVDEEQLENLIAAAKRKGKYVEIDPVVKKYLAENERYHARTFRANEGLIGKLLAGIPNIFTLKYLNPKDRKAREDYFNKLILDCNSNAKQVIDARKNSSEYIEAKEKLSAQHYNKALNSEKKLADTDAKAKLIADDLAPLSTEEKIKKIKDGFEKIEDRIRTLDASRAALEKQTTNLENELSKMDSSKVNTDEFKKLQERITNNKTERLNLLNAIIKEQADLQKLSKIYGDNLETMKGGLVTDAQAKEYFDAKVKAEKSEESLAQLVAETKSGMSKKSPSDLQKEIAAANKVHETDNKKVSDLGASLDPAVKNNIDSFRSLQKTFENSEKTLAALNEQINGKPAVKDSKMEAPVEGVKKDKPTPPDKPTGLKAQVERLLKFLDIAQKRAPSSTPHKPST